MSRLVLRNTTQYDDDEVERLVRSAMSALDLPSKHSVLVRVSHTQPRRRRRRGDWTRWGYGASGLAFKHVFVRPDTPRNAAWEIHLRIGRPGDFPIRWYDRYGTSAGILLADWREALTMIAAHEGKHVEDYQHGTDRGRRRTHAQVEGTCDGFAAKALRRMREEER